jgi:hypothetical protein
MYLCSSRSNIWCTRYRGLMRRYLRHSVKCKQIIRYALSRFTEGIPRLENNQEIVTKHVKL